MKRSISFCIILSIVLITVIWRGDIFLSGKKETTTINNIGVTAIIKECVIDKSVDAVTMVLQNNTNKQYYYGIDFTLEKESINGWVKIPFKEDIFFIQIAIILGEYETKEEIINLSYFNNLDEGKYRVGKHLSGEGESLTVTAEFEIVS